MKRNKVYLDNIDKSYEGAMRGAILTGIKFDTIGNDAVAIALHFSEFEVTDNHAKYLTNYGWQSNASLNDR